MSSSTIQPTPPSFSLPTSSSSLLHYTFCSHQSINKPHHHQFHIHTNMAHERDSSTKWNHSILNQARREPASFTNQILITLLRPLPPMAHVSLTPLIFHKMFSPQKSKKWKKTMVTKIKLQI